MNRQRIAIFTVCRNEVELIPHFLAYHKKIVDHIYVYDNNSTDGTRELLEKASEYVTIIHYDTNGLLRDDLHMLIKNSCWQQFKTQYEWVIVTDLDEFLYHKNLNSYLIQAKIDGYSILNTIGFNMISESYPEIGRPIDEQVRYGAYSTNFSKPIIFDPKLLLQVNFAPGGHTANPEGVVKVKESDGLLLLHFKYLGGINRLQKRWNIVGKELSPENEKYKWGIKRKLPQVIQQRYEYVQNNKEDVFKCNTKSYRNRERSLI